jgi:hypothetical protein
MGIIKDTNWLLVFKKSNYGILCGWVQRENYSWQEGRKNYNTLSN